jgi:hypothetical protein
MPALVATLADVRSRKVRVVTVDSDKPSPFAAALLFSYVASFLYDGDAPLAERRAQALAVDQTQLRELVGAIELRDLVDAESMEAIERQLQRLDPRYQAKSADGVHDMLLAIGDLTPEELRARTTTREVADSVDTLVGARRVPVRASFRELRHIAVEDAARYRDAIGVPLPPGIPESLLEPVRDPLGDLALRYARTHAPFTAADFASRYNLAGGAAEAVLARLTAEGRLVEGEFRPGGTRQEWTDPAVLRMLRRRSLAKLRQEVEPVDQTVVGRFTTTWQGIIKRRSGVDALLDAIEQLQGAPLPASILETEILPARIDGYDPADLDALRRPAKSSGLASKRSASGTTGSRSISPITSRDCCRRRATSDRGRTFRGMGVGSARRRTLRRPDPTYTYVVSGFRLRVKLRRTAVASAEAVSRHDSSTRSGISSGTASLVPTTRRFTRCGRSRGRAPRGARRAARTPLPLSARAASRLRQRKAAGLSCGRTSRTPGSGSRAPRRNRHGSPRLTPPSGLRRWRSNCSRGTACSPERPWRRKPSPAVLASCIPC